MNQSCNFCILYHSRLLSLPILGDFFYLIQIQFLNVGILTIFTASDKKSKNRNILFKKISKKFNKIYCRSTKFARNLQSFKDKELVLDKPNLKKIGAMDRKELYDLMWSLVFCKSVTQKTKGALRNFLPINYPVVENV